MNVINMVLLVMIVVAGIYMATNYTREVYKKKKGVLIKNHGTRKLQRKVNWEDWKDFFWRNPEQFAWITVILSFITLFGLAIGNIVGYIISFIFLVLLVLFLRWAKENYLNFPKIAKERLDKFNEEVRTAIKKQVTFEADNIQKFADKDSEFDTEPKVFEFPVDTKKMPAHPTYKVLKDIIIEQKLEFLVLSREYFSICQSAPTFKLFDHRVAGKLEHKKGGPGACNEFYYSQMANVQYDGKAIRIIYDGEREDAVFTCKPGDKATQPAIKALKEKLRLTERQKFHKMQEHLSYEEIKAKRIKSEKEDKDSA
ncbi:hypothetical protein MNB_SV-12-647 [hydrothermal vent metagenome]|uniref:Uncharacterized protein n=1 Tax=hydrothermal vent metagenome TaxID=652676 RepID=A0A1W1BHN4_9ZZZZ